MQWLGERETEQDGVTAAWQVERCYTNDKKESAMVSRERETEQDGVTAAWQVERCYTNDKKESAMVSREREKD